ncbi:MAG: hypothetical protein JXQ71_05625 [Verrucomicrobia bacterium]|nr:hypothetical protein [Verrucomicrobiota bacterium]
MKHIEHDELFQNLSGFLKTKGIALKPGIYTRRIRQGCSLLSDTINLAEQGFQRARTEIDSKLDQMRKIITQGPPSSSSPRPPRPRTAARRPRKSRSAARTPKRASRVVRAA